MNVSTVVLSKHFA